MESEDGQLAKSAPNSAHPRTLPADKLVAWANKNDEWVRCIVSGVLKSSGPILPTEIDNAFELFLQEKKISPRTLVAQPPLLETQSAEAGEETFLLTRISDVVAVNALISSVTIEFNQGLTILYGENGTGKTGYSRILKKLANSRTVDEILTNINELDEQSPSAMVTYELGGKTRVVQWKNEKGITPFTRMTIFDSNSVNLHVDENLTYVFTPSSLALFKHVTSGIQEVQRLIDEKIDALTKSRPNFLERFERGSTIYPMIEQLGAAFDGSELEAELEKIDDDAPSKIKSLQIEVGGLKSDAIPNRLKLQQRRLKVIEESTNCLKRLNQFDIDSYNETVNRKNGLLHDYIAFRETLFASADLPAPPDDNWDNFVKAGHVYREHLVDLGMHDTTRCLYCRQTLTATAIELLNKYHEYLEDGIAIEIEICEKRMMELTQDLRDVTLSEVSTYVASHDVEDVTDEVITLQQLMTLHATVLEISNQNGTIEKALLAPVKSLLDAFGESKRAVDLLVDDLKMKSANVEQMLLQKEEELLELMARVELERSWTEIDEYLKRAKVASKMRTLHKTIPNTLRSLTELSTKASNELINQSFEQLFEEECGALRAPNLKLDFIGRDSTTIRRKLIPGNHRPSKVLSEGEQKTIALADFLAESRLTGSSAPIVFDDPVSSLDHRRIIEVATRIAKLAQSGQVIVFTHDIFFVTNLLSLFEKSERCSYFQVTDANGKGEVSRSTGPRSDSMSFLKKKVNETIQSAKSQGGETKEALIRSGYGWLRSWCEVFVETELLAEVSQRYQPNVKMGALLNIKPKALPQAIGTVTQIFNSSSRYIESHSQPLVTLGVAPTLEGLEKDWKDLTTCRSDYLNAAN